MSLIFATQLTAIATAVLAQFAIVTAFYARSGLLPRSGRHHLNLRVTLLLLALVLGHVAYPDLCGDVNACPRKELPCHRAAVRKRILRASAISLSPLRRGIGGNGIAYFILGGDGSATGPVVHDHCAGGGQGGVGRPVVVAA